MTELQMGPIDYLALEFPQGKLRGEGLAALVDLVDRNIIRILDLRVVMVGEGGAFTAVALTDLDGDGVLDLAMFEGIQSGLLDDDDVAQSASLSEPGNAVGLIVYENTWAEPFVTAMRHVGAEVIASGRIPAQDVLDALDRMDTASA